LIDFQKYSLDELVVRFSEQEFDCLILQVTTKDEEKLNEIYYQSNYILKKGGRLFIIGREHWGLAVSEKFKLISEETIKKGDSVHKTWLMKKK